MCCTQAISNLECGYAGAPYQKSIPTSHTIAYASPEVLQSKLKHLAGKGTTYADYAVDILAAEQWSAGAVMCEILLKQQPFEPSALGGMECPAHLNSHACLLWAAHHNTLQAMQPWVCYCCASVIV